MAIKRLMIMTHETKGEFEPKWKGPLVVETIYSNNAYCSINQDGDRLMTPLSGKILKKYYI